MYTRCALLPQVQEQTTARRGCISSAGSANHDIVLCASCGLRRVGTQTHKWPARAYRYCSHTTPATHNTKLLTVQLCGIPVTNTTMASRNPSHGTTLLPPCPRRAPPPPEMVPPLVHVLAGNVVTAAMVAACLDTIDANALRRLHPAIAVAIAEVPWTDTTTPVRDIARWRAALPAAVGLKSGVFDDADVARLPPTLRSLDVSYCERLSQRVSFTHLPALESLDCSSTDVGMGGVACLPPSLRKLCMKYCKLDQAADFSHLRSLRVLEWTKMSSIFSAATIASLPPSLTMLDIGRGCLLNNGEWPAGGSLAHLTRLRVLGVAGVRIDAPALATFPPSLHSLDLTACTLAATASFEHLHCLRKLSASNSNIGDAVLTTMPPSLAYLGLQYAAKCGSPCMTLAAVFPHLPALRVLNVSGTALGDAAVASMPPGLVELRMVDCANVTQRASLDHLTALGGLHSSGTDLSPATLASCRARGCTAPADGIVSNEKIPGSQLLISLPDGRMVGCFHTSVPCVVLWEAVRLAPPLAEVRIESPLSNVTALAALPDGHRVAIAVCASKGAPGGIVMWNTRDASQTAQVITSATIGFDDGLQPSALAVLHDGHLAVGFANGRLRIVDVDTTVVIATLDRHTHKVAALSVLQNGHLASGSWDRTVRVWDVDAIKCIVTFEGHRDCVCSLVALPDGRLVSTSHDGRALLWDASNCTFLGMLPWQLTGAYGLSLLPNSHQLAHMSSNDMQVYDTRDAAGAPILKLRLTVELAGSQTLALVPLPDGRLATGGNSGVRLWQLPLDAVRAPP